MTVASRVRRITTPAGDPAWLVTSYQDVKQLLNDPRLGRSHADPGRAPRFVKSAIFGGPMGSPETSMPSTRRCAAASGGLPRYAHADIELDGANIKVGDLVLLALHYANVDHAVFPHADEFDVRRVDNPHLTFGHGSRYCIGAPLARIELQSVLATLVRRVPSLRLAVAVEDLRPKTHLLTGGLAELPVTW